MVNFSNLFNPSGGQTFSLGMPNSSASKVPTTPTPTVQPTNSTISANNSATSPALKTPAAQTYVQNQLDQYGQTSGDNSPTAVDARLAAMNPTPTNTQNNVQTPTNNPTPTTTQNNTNPTPTSTGNSYLDYLNTQFNPTNINNLSTANTNAQQKLADIQNQQDKLTQGFREQQNATLDQPGGLLAGAQQAASVEGRRASTSLADLAVQESAAARSAGVAQNSYNTALGAGKSLYDAQQANKPIAVGGQNYQLNPSTGKYEVQQNSGSVGGVGGLSSDAVNFWAQVGASGVNLNSLIPSLGMGSAAVATKQALLEKMATNAQTLGIDGSTFGAMLSDSKVKVATQAALQKQGSLLAVNEDKTNKDFDLVKSLGQKLDANSWNVASPVLNNWLRTGQLATTGNADINNYLGALTTTLTAYAKVVGGQTTGAGITEGMNNEIQGLISKGLNTQAVNSYIDNVAKKEMNNTVSSYDTALKGLFGNIASLKDTTGGLGGNTNSSTDNSGGNLNTQFGWNP